MSEIYDYKRCSSCRGKCCRLFLSAEEGGMRSLQYWFDEWCYALNEIFIESGALIRDDNAVDGVSANPAHGIPQSHKPIISHMSKIPEQYLEHAGVDVDVDYCFFHSKEKGCLLPIEFKPKACKEYMCSNEQFEFLNGFAPPQ